MEIAWQFDYAIGIEKLTTSTRRRSSTSGTPRATSTGAIESIRRSRSSDEERSCFDRSPFIQQLSKAQRETFTAHIARAAALAVPARRAGRADDRRGAHARGADYEAKLYAATQTMDEARHVEVYERYIRKLAIVYPMSPWLKELIDATLTADHWVKIAIGMNMVVEGLALGAFHNMRRQTTCELLRKIPRTCCRTSRATSRSATCTSARRSRHAPRRARGRRAVRVRGGEGDGRRPGRASTAAARASRIPAS